MLPQKCFPHTHSKMLQKLDSMCNLVPPSHFFICCFEDMLGHGSLRLLLLLQIVSQHVLQVQDPVPGLHSVIRLTIHSIPVFRPPAHLAKQTTDNIHKHVADRTKTGDSRKWHLQRRFPVGVCHKVSWVAVDWADGGFKKEEKKEKGVQGKVHQQHYRCVTINYYSKKNGTIRARWHRSNMLKKQRGITRWRHPFFLSSIEPAIIQHALIVVSQIHITGFWDADLVVVYPLISRVLMDEVRAQLKMWGLLKCGPHINLHIRDAEDSLPLWGLWGKALLWNSKMNYPCFK